MSKTTLVSIARSLVRSFICSQHSLTWEEEKEGGRERGKEGGREGEKEREGGGGEVKKRDIKKSKDTKKDPPFTTFFWSARATFTGNDVMLHYVMSCLVMLLL